MSTLGIGKLSLKMLLTRGQTLSNFLSSLAAENGMRSTSRFCQAFGIDAAGLARGEESAVLALAQLSVWRLAICGQRAVGCARPAICIMVSTLTAISFEKMPMFARGAWMKTALSVHSIAPTSRHGAVLRGIILGWPLAVTIIYAWFRYLVPIHRQFSGTI